MTIETLFEDGKKPNIVLILTDQERSFTHWPEEWVKENLPGMNRLCKNGVHFRKTYTSSCNCAPSRASILTSTYPQVHGIQKTSPPPPAFSIQPPFPLQVGLDTVATVVKSVGYKCSFFGKWHLGGEDVGGPVAHGFDEWNGPDCGNSLALDDTIGGGDPNHDGRILNDVKNFLRKQTPDQPFLVVVSFINPHDAFVAQLGPGKGYTVDDMKKHHMDLPLNCDHNGEGKPRAQPKFAYDAFPPPEVLAHYGKTERNSKQDYINFYAYLNTLADNNISGVLDEMDSLGLTDDTLVVRFADHGELATAHNLTEKMLCVYDEAIHVPMVWSNPKAFPEGKETESLASTLDICPTLATLLGVRKNFRTLFGRNLVPTLKDPAVEAQDAVHFCYDDVGFPDAPSLIRCVRTNKYKYAVYFNETGTDADWELYDMDADPTEDNNLAGKSEYRNVQLQHEAKLVEMMKVMHTMPPEFKWPPTATEASIGVLASERAGGKEGRCSKIRAIRTAKYKYVVFFNDDGTDADWSLFNIEKDPEEEQNLAGSAVYRKVQMTMDALLVEKMNDMNSTPTKFKWPPTATAASEGVLAKGRGGKLEKKEVDTKWLKV